VAGSLTAPLVEPHEAVMGAAGAVVYALSLATAPWVVDRPVIQWASQTAGRKAGREDRFQLSGR